MQSSKVSCILHIFLATLLVVLLLHSYASAANWDDFQNRHIAPRPNIHENLNAYCDRMMRARQMTKHRCKDINTFIHAETSDVQNVCPHQSTYWKLNLFDSIRRFDLTNCNFIGGRPPSNCRYRGEAVNRHISVACSNLFSRGNPIHFAGAKP